MAPFLFLSFIFRSKKFEVTVRIRFAEVRAYISFSYTSKELSYYKL